MVLAAAIYVGLKQLRQVRITTTSIATVPGLDQGRHMMNGIDNVWSPGCSAASQGRTGKLGTGRVSELRPRSPHCGEDYD
jgi:hypothetical protein